MYSGLRHSVLLFGLLSSAAYGQSQGSEEPGTGPVMISEPSDTQSRQIRKQRWMPYPVRVYGDAQSVKTCIMEVTIDNKGKPKEMEAIDCEPELEAWTRKRLRRWRWEKSESPMSTIEVTIDYQPPWVDASLPQPMYWRRRGGEQCEGVLHFGTDGEPREETQWMEGCPTPVLTALDPIEKPRKQSWPVLCPVTFVVRDFQATGIETFRCPSFVRREVKTALLRAQWGATPGEDFPFSLVVVFHGE